MPKDYYPDMDSEMPAAAGAGAGTEAKPEETEEEGEDTVLIPKGILQGKEFKVGDEVVLKLTHEYEEDFAAEYASEEPNKGPKLPGREDFDAADKGEAYA